MGKFRHILRRWLGAIFKDQADAELLPLLIPTNNSVNDPWNPYLEPLLDLSAIAVNGTSIDLPQEIVDHVMFMLRHDLKSLKACSLTSKTFFISARPFIHRKIWLTSELNWEILTLREKQRYIRGDRQGLALKTLSGIAAHGFLRFGRHLFIHIYQNFTPANLQPFNDHFQRFDCIQELSIRDLNAQSFLGQFDAFFANLVPTLRSLHLDMPTGDSQDILDFVCRFPHLDDLTLKASPDSPRLVGTWESVPPSIVKKMPPFRGRLRLDNILYGRHYYMLRQLLSLPGKRRFRFIDFRGCFPEVEQPIINALPSIETLSITWRKLYQAIDQKALPLNLANVQNLRSFTLRIHHTDFMEPYESLPKTLHTITSPFFSEFVLELESVWNPLRAWWWKTCAEIEEIFQRIDEERGFKVIVRAREVEEKRPFIALVRERFPLMNARERLFIEIGPFPEE